jgi:hypothetical protein
MKPTHYHGSPVLVDGKLKEGTCVSSSKCAALIFARRKCQGNCYIYSLVLNPGDLYQDADGAGIVDCRLRHATAFLERIPVTKEMIAECEAEAASLRE